jgi:hypothetical protein
MVVVAPSSSSAINHTMLRGLGLAIVRPPNWVFRGKMWNLAGNGGSSPGCTVDLRQVTVRY